MNLQDWLYYAAAAWFVAYVITSTSGPFAMFMRLREIGGGRWHGRDKSAKVVTFNPITKEEKIAYEIPATKDGLLDCIICLMPYVALALRLIGANVIFDAFAIAGIALMLHGYTGWRHNIS